MTEYKNTVIDPNDSKRELYDDFIERYLFTLSNSYIPVAKCASFVSQRKNRDLQQTITYLTRYNSYKRLCKRFQLHTRLDIVAQAISSVRETIANDMEDDDISQIAELAFYQAQSKYKPDRGIPFKNFLFHYYKWLFVNELKKNLWHVPVSNVPSIVDEFDGSYTEDNIRHISYIAKNIDSISFKQVEFESKDVILSDNIDYTWVVGETCSWVVKDLDLLERLVLKKIYVDELSIRKVAEELGFYPRMIKNMVDNCKVKIREAMNLEDEDDTDIGK